MAVIASWITMMIGILALVPGVITLATHRVSLPWLRGRVHWRTYGWAEVCLGLSLLMNGAPRVAGASAGVAFLLSGIAFLVMGAGVVGLSQSHVAARPKSEHTYSCR